MATRACHSPIAIQSYLAVLLACALVLASLAASTLPAAAASPPTLAVLGTFFQNDNEGLEPTTDAERARLKRTGDAFAAQLADSGRYEIVPVPDTMRARIAAGQLPGECGGCEADYGRALAANLVAWIRVQKVSNLILNMNVYIADVKSGRMLLTRSVDLRGNTDDSWSRSLAYLVKNAVLPADVKPAAYAPRRGARYFTPFFHFSTAASVFATWPLGSSAVYS